MIVLTDLADVFKNMKPNSSAFIQGAMATPTELLSQLKKVGTNLENIELMHLHTHGEEFYNGVDVKKNFRITNFFVGGNVRKILDYERVDYLPCFLSEIPNLFRKKIKKVDYAFIHVSPPNEHGFCTLGTSVDVTKAAVESADFVIAQINKQMPTVHGDGFIHVNNIDYAIEVDIPVHEPAKAVLTDIERQIGNNIASLIENGSTLQMGIGAIPDAVLGALHNHKDLGIHTEMFSDEAVKLIKSGAVNNSKKKFHQGKTVSSFIVGSKEVLDFVNDNPSVSLLEADYVNNPRNIARNPKVVAINSALEIDLTGQVCADSLGHNIYSGVGGQMDFIRGASLSDGGKPIIALPSQTNKGISKISACLKPGAGVVTTRSHIHYLATEYGVVDLYGKTLHERVKLILSIAHPDHRENLEKQWHDCHRRI
ncbi:acetyl-CoA hydrolase/transferase family protein [Bacteriovorax sp. Seq25_V]|uniref:acetyl-CoA hydrolase/transferase family protein n=1 Tax=Bacteriovorax sp. Seq25_V TaxID=1201288 RepID=UPI00038A066E|nr:acetyl-CoA hydrolase/transferase C-terminal domain-containing protein [Bacteriovorax sp. Seq25_V]EQC48082.1 putative 4-hydroxybutyrate coenzyme A transferase [Bacteriovorax sp. Seq25_V]